MAVGAITAAIAFAGGFFAAASRRPRPVESPAVASAPVAQHARRDERFDSLVRALPLGVMMLDLQGRIAYANRAAGAIFGFHPKRARGMHIIEAIPSIELEKRIAAVVAGDTAAPSLIVSGKAVNRTYAVSVYPLSTEDTKLSGALLLAEDRTELIATERARQEFLSNVSHELRTPLSSIKLMLETVVASPDEETADVFVPQALAQVDRLAALVQRFLEQARAESRGIDLRLELTPLNGIIEPIVASFMPRAEAQEIALTFEGDDVQAEVDAQSIAQVIVNLIDNALRYTASGGKVRIRARSDDTFATITVKDNGIGIPFKDQPHIFERFYVVDRSRTRDSSGVGLGLSIVKQIVEAHRGTITVESLLGSGTTFALRLPLRQSDPGIEKA